MVKVLVEMEIKGLLDKDVQGMPDNQFSNTYSFFEFRSVIEHRKDLFSQPAGVYCQGQSFKSQLPKLPDVFSFYETIKLNSELEPVLTKVEYNGEISAFRVDFPGNVELIADFYSGVAYTISNDLNVCTYNAINSEFFYSHIVKENKDEFGTYYTINKPGELFLLDDMSFYAGKRFERGILCDVYTSRRFDQLNNAYVADVYMRNNLSQVVTDPQNVDKNIPISAHLYSQFSETFNQTQEYYDFNTNYNPTFASTANCFAGNDKISFGVRFTYPDNLLENMQAKEEFERDYQLSKLYQQLLTAAFSQYSVSRVRVSPPQILSDQKGFSVFGSVVSSAPAICK